MATLDEFRILTGLYIRRKHSYLGDIEVIILPRSCSRVAPMRHRRRNTPQPADIFHTCLLSVCLLPLDGTICDLDFGVLFEEGLVDLGASPRSIDGPVSSTEALEWTSDRQQRPHFVSACTPAGRCNSSAG